MKREQASGLTSGLLGLVLLAGCAEVQTVETLAGRSEQEIRALEKGEKEDEATSTRFFSILTRTLQQAATRRFEDIRLGEILDPYAAERQRQAARPPAERRPPEPAAPAPPPGREPAEVPGPARPERREPTPGGAPQELGGAGTPGGERREAPPAPRAEEGRQALVARVTALYRAAGFSAPASVASAPDFSLPSLEGREVRLSDLRGKVVLLSFWATWCPPCMREMPERAQLRRRLQGEAFEVVAVSVDPRGAEEALRNAARNFGLPFPVLLDPEREVLQRYGGQAIPFTVLIGPQGEVLGRRVGLATRWDTPEMVELVRSLLRLFPS